MTESDQQIVNAMTSLKKMLKRAILESATAKSWQFCIDDTAVGMDIFSLAHRKQAESGLRYFSHRSMTENRQLHLFLRSALVSIRSLKKTEKCEIVDTRTSRLIHGIHASLRIIDERPTIVIGSIEHV